MLDRIRKIISKMKQEPVFHQYLWYIIISILLGIGFKYGYDGFVSLIKPLLDIFHISSVSSIEHSYLFSTTAAILSTVFTIIFVLLTLFIQVSDVYISADIFRSNETKNLMILYFVTIFLSLMMLETTFQFPILVLILTFACILSLYPFLCNISDKLAYEVGVLKLYDEIPSLISLKNESLARAKISSLAKICKRSIKDDRKYDFYNIMPFFQTCVTKAKQQKMVAVIERIGSEYSDILDYLIINNQTNNNNNNNNNNNKFTMFSLTLIQIDYYVANCFEMVNYTFIYGQTCSLINTGTKMIKADFDDKHVDQIIESIVNIIYSVQMKREMDKKKREVDGEPKIEYWEYNLESKILEYFGELATEIYNPKQEPSSLTTLVIAFFAIGARSCQLSDKLRLETTLTRVTVIEQLKNIENIIGSNNFEELFKEVKYPKRHIPFFTEEDKAYLDEFKKSYELQQKIKFITGSR